MTANHHDLPHGLRLITEAAGEEAALRVALAARGRRLRIPQRAEGSSLEEMAGLPAARLIVAALADEVLEIPLAKKALAFWLRDSRAWSIRKIANRLGVAPRTLDYWFSDTTPSRQADLFDRAG